MLYYGEPANYSDQNMSRRKTQIILPGKVSFKKLLKQDNISIHRNEGLQKQKGNNTIHCIIPFVRTAYGTFFEPFFARFEEVSFTFSVIDSPTQMGSLFLFTSLRIPRHEKLRYKHKPISALIAYLGEHGNPFGQRSKNVAPTNPA